MRRGGGHNKGPESRVFGDSNPIPAVRPVEQAGEHIETKMKSEPRSFHVRIGLLTSAKR